VFKIYFMRSIWRTLDRRGLADIGLTCVAVFFIGLSYGAIAVASGFPLWVPAALSVLVLAGASEFLFIGIVAAGGSPIAAALAGLLVNSRHLPYGLALPPGVTGRRWGRLFGTHVMNDESVVFALAQPDLPAKRAAYWACGLGVLACWPGGAVLGALIGSVVHDTNAFGLDAMFPAVILALIVKDLRDARTRRAAVAGAAIALAATPFLPAGLPVLLALTAVVLTP
jgi:4-azaleucine resistance transporter AzlC